MKSLWIIYQNHKLLVWQRFYKSLLGNLGKNIKTNMLERKKEYEKNIIINYLNSNHYRRYHSKLYHHPSAGKRYNW